MPDAALADPNESEWHTVLVEFVAANDIDSTLWTAQETLAAQNFFAGHQRGMPSIDQFITLFGKKAFDAALQAIFAEKKLRTTSWVSTTPVIRAVRKTVSVRDGRQKDPEYFSNLLVDLNRV